MIHLSIPQWTAQGVLPPINSSIPTTTDRSPYEVSLTDVVLRYATSPERNAIFEGFLRFRAALHAAGLDKGFQWIEIETRGQTAHGSRPDDGRDAILRMGRVLSRLESLGRRLQTRSAHRLLGTASLHASIIAGGPHT